MDIVLGNHLRLLPGPIMVTGHTGFKGTWLTLLLERLGIPVVGYSLAPEPNSLFNRTNRTGAIPEVFSDIGDLKSLQEFMTQYQPSAVIHMAAQPIVLESYAKPGETFSTNVMGTVNVLVSAFATNSVKAVAVVTTDKVYRNDNAGRSFIESDALEGKDPYSASKVGAEAVVAAWQQISKISGGPKVISLRAGNIIGGGDWATSRLLPDLLRGFIDGSLVSVRNPESTRPWQHVLDPVRGYVMALEAILKGAAFQALNFGPDSKSLSVREVVEISQKFWPSLTSVNFSTAVKDKKIEAVALQLDSSLARNSLGWKSHWTQDESVALTIRWWDKVLNRSIDPKTACEMDLDELLRENF